MKLVHISDIHIHHDLLLGHDPVLNFAACLAHVAEFHDDAERIVITGDLTHRGLESSYHTLKAMLDASPLKGRARPILLVGNHDDRPAMRKVFAETADDGQGYVQWREQTPSGVFLYLDTAEAGTHEGHYGPDRQQWLIDQLALCRAESQQAFLFMHHNPARVHVANADRIGIVEEAAFQAILKDHRDIIRHIFFGHCHFTLSGTVAGIPFSAPRSTNHACWPDFSGIAGRMGYGDISPNYNVCILEPDNTVIHSIDFLQQDRVRWQLD